MESIYTSHYIHIKFDRKDSFLKFDRKLHPKIFYPLEKVVAIPGNSNFQAFQKK